MNRTIQVGERSKALRAPEELALPGLWVRHPHRMKRLARSGSKGRGAGRARAPVEPALPGHRVRPLEGGFDRNEVREKRGWA